MKVNKKLLAALCGTSAMLLALSGCGGNNTGKQLDTWAKGVCDLAAGQIKKIDDANTAISKVDSGGKPQAVKSADSAAFRTISDAYKSLAGIFSSAATAPGGTQGQQSQQNAVTVFNGLSSQYAALKKQVDGLNTSDQSKFADGLKGVSDTLNKTTTGAQTSLDTLRQGATGNALAKQPGCQQVAGASPSAS